jgi:hypothetical protein
MKSGAVIVGPHFLLAPFADGLPWYVSLVAEDFEAHFFLRNSAASGHVAKWLTPSGLTGIFFSGCLGRGMK